MISLIVPPGDQVSKVAKMLNDEAGTASNIKSRVNRLSGAAAWCFVLPLGLKWPQCWTPSDPPPTA